MIRFIYTLLVLFTLGGPVTAQQLKFFDNDTAVALFDEGKLRFLYRTKTVDWPDPEFPRASYIHPLSSLSGEILTADFPPDHPHHHGIFWAWHQLYLHGKRIGDPWISDGLIWRVENVRHKILSKEAILSAEVYWDPLKTGMALPLVREDLQIAYSRGKGHYLLDIEVELNALREGVGLGGSEDFKGYGGFSVRLVREPLAFFDQNGPVEALEGISVITDWIGIRNISSNPGEVMVLIADRSELPSFQGWILRTTGSMQNPAFPGKDPIILQVEEPIRMRQRIIVFEKEPKTRYIKKLSDRFLK